MNNWVFGGIANRNIEIRDNFFLDTCFELKIINFRYVLVVIKNFKQYKLFLDFILILILKCSHLW